MRFLLPTFLSHFIRVSLSSTAWRLFYDDLWGSSLGPLAGVLDLIPTHLHETNEACRLDTILPLPKIIGCLQPTRQGGSINTSVVLYFSKIIEAMRRSLDRLFWLSIEWCTPSSYIHLFTSEKNGLDLFPYGVPL